MARQKGDMLTPVVFDRIKHFRGHGIHSPFAYGLVRNALMRRTRLTSDSKLLTSLKLAGVKGKHSFRLQNIYTYCNFTAFAIDNKLKVTSRTLYIATKKTDAEHISVFAETLKGTESALCIVSPRANCLRNRLCAEIIASHNGMSIDMGGILIIFYDDKLNKQYIKI